MRRRDRALGQLPPLELIETTPPGRSRLRDARGYHFPATLHRGAMDLRCRSRCARASHLASTSDPSRSDSQRPASTDSWKVLSPSGRRLLDHAPSPGRRPCLGIGTARGQKAGVRALDELHSWRPPEALGGLDPAILDWQLAGSTAARASGPSTLPSSSSRRPGPHTLGVALCLAADGTSRARHRAVRPLAPRCAGSGRDVVECVSASRVEPGRATSERRA